MNKVNKSLNLFMNGLLVGHLTKLSSRNLTFGYDQTWLKMPEARPISLSLPLTTESYEGDKVYNFFDNLLPDNELIRARIQVLLNASSKQPFDLLSVIGHDCVGAIQLSHREELTHAQTMHAEPISDKEIANLLMRCYSRLMVSLKKCQVSLVILFLALWLRPYLRGCWIFEIVW